MDPIIVNLWEEIINFGYTVRKNNKDVKLAWTEVKKILPEVHFDWNKKSAKFYNELVDLGLTKADTPESAGIIQSVWERQRFLLEHGRIILINPKGSLLRLLQIAYNVGLFKFELEKQLYLPEQMRYYIVNELNKITTFVEKIEKLPTETVKMLQINFPDLIKNDNTLITKENTENKITGGMRYNYNIPNYQIYFNEYISKLK
jgi:hypothetical protein